jgi:hypothetical protein
MSCALRVTGYPEPAAATSPSTLGAWRLALAWTCIAWWLPVVLFGSPQLVQCSARVSTLLWCSLRCSGSKSGMKCRQVATIECLLHSISLYGA